MSPPISPPPELPDGQDGPPDTRATVVVVLQLLDDLQDHLARDGTAPADLLLRLVAVRSVLRRLRRHLQEGGAT